ncbi:MAG: hypothetical protein FJ344_03450 [Sphingomonadales bacterium]|nr:hypothetical protein [Sphingomonadales bacterium]
MIRWQKKQGLTLVITGLLMGAAVYVADAWKSRQLLAQVYALPILESPPEWQELVSREPLLQSDDMNGVVLLCSDYRIDPLSALPKGIPREIKVLYLYPDSLSQQAMDHWRVRQREAWPDEWQRQRRLYEELERERLRTALDRRGDERMREVRAALLPMELLSKGQTRAYRSSMVSLLFGEFAQHCIGNEESRWLLIYDGSLHQEIRNKFTKNPRIRYEEWGN